MQGHVNLKAYREFDARKRALRLERPAELFDFAHAAKNRRTARMPQVNRFR